jgi:hypothetical protein
VAGRTPALFEQHCRDAKAFLDGRDGEMGPPLKMCLIEAWNEWGEGSYIGPHREYGFDYLEAVRKVFAPDSPKPPPLTPRDLGLGPYEVPRPDPDAPTKTAWDFTQADDRADWAHPHQATLDAAGEALQGVATGNDPILNGPVVRIPAEQYPWLCVEMRTSRPETVQLFWATTTGPVSEGNSVRFGVPGDGRVHAHWVHLAATPAWTGLVKGLRFDPATRPGVAFALRSLRFAPERPKD